MPHLRRGRFVKGRNLFGGSDIALKNMGPSRLKKSIPSVYQPVRPARGKKGKKKSHKGDARRVKRHPGGKNLHEITNLEEDPSLLDDEAVTRDAVAVLEGDPPQKAPQGISLTTFSIWAASLLTVAIIIVFLVWWLRRRSAFMRVAETKQREALAKASSVVSLKTPPERPIEPTPSTTWGAHPATHARQQTSMGGEPRGESNIWATQEATSTFKNRFSDI